MGEKGGRTVIERMEEDNMAAGGVGLTCNVSLSLFSSSPRRVLSGRSTERSCGPPVAFPSRASSSFHIESKSCTTHCRCFPCHSCQGGEEEVEIALE